VHRGKGERPVRIIDDIAAAEKIKAA